METPKFSFMLMFWTWKSINYFTESIDFSWNICKFVHCFNFSLFRVFEKNFLASKQKPKRSFLTLNISQTRKEDRDKFSVTMDLFSMHYKDISMRNSFWFKSFIVMTDSLSTKLKQCVEVHKNIASKCSFLANSNVLVDDIKKSVENLIKDYLNDVDVNIVPKIKHFQANVKKVLDINPVKGLLIYMRSFFKINYCHLFQT